jgi:hypothetical protein
VRGRGSPALKGGLSGWSGRRSISPPQEQPDECQKQDGMPT